MIKNKIIKTLLISLFFLTSFLIGVVFSDTIKNSYVNNFLKSIINSKNEGKDFNNNGIIVKNKNGYASSGDKVEYSDSVLGKIFDSNKKDLDLKEFWNVYNIIRNNYYDVDGLTKQELVYGTIKGLVEATGDKHSVFMTPKETKRFGEVLGGEFQGIGAVVRKNDLGVEIDQVLKGAPAQKSGLRAKDIIIKAGGKELIDLDLADAVEFIKGPAGTKVELVILRKGEKDFITKEVVREKVEVPSVESKVFKNNIGYIAINTFGATTSKDFTIELEKIKKENIKGLILDLRDNGGGYLTSAVEILSHFIEKEKLLVSIKYRNKNNEERYFSDKNIKKENLKIVILINESSASASEITTLGLREYNKGIIIGKKSYGKGSVQEQFPAFSDKSTLKLTIAKWFTPNGINIDGKGIEPDIEIDFEKKDYTPEVGKEKEFEFYDRQLEVSKVVLQKFIKNGFLQSTIDEYFVENPKKNKKEKK